MVETGGPGDRGRNIAIALVQLTVRHVAVMVQGGESAAPPAFSWTARACVVLSTGRFSSERLPVLNFRGAGFSLIWNQGTGALLVPKKG